MTISNLIAYFENLASLHKSILHSEATKRFYSDISELIDNIKNTPPLLVVLGPPEFEPVDDLKDNILERNTTTLLILRLVTARNSNTSNQIAAYDECKSIALDFVSRMKHDESEQTGGVDFTDINRYHIEPVGPIMDHYFGVQLDIEFDDNDINLDFDESKWDE
jgi:hypothetical protein